MKVILLTIFTFCFLNVYSQFKHTEGLFYEKPTNIENEILYVDLILEDSTVLKNQCIYRKVIWERKLHSGFYYIPNFYSGEWVGKKAEFNTFYWTFTWSEWKICE